MPVPLPPYLQGQGPGTKMPGKRNSPAADEHAARGYNEAELNNTTPPDFMALGRASRAVHGRLPNNPDEPTPLIVQQYQQLGPPAVPATRAWEETGPMTVEAYAQKYGAAAAQQYARYLADPNYRGSPSSDTPMNPGTPQYATGGLIGPGGQNQTPAPGAPPPAATPGQAGLSAQGQPGGQPMSAQVIDMRLQEMMSNNPQMVEKIKAAITAAMQSGELTAQELNMMAQLAKLAAQNPGMYPKIRQFAIANGIATDQDLPQQYDEGLVITILAAAKAAQGGATPQQNAGGQPAAEGQPAQASMATGGPTPKSPNADGSTKIIAHEGEYVIPAHVVRQKGTDFFDKMIGVEKPK